ncbi:helix-turn-helix domain-containing protein [Joostella sp. CR20]|uniref:helix-turn-helix domain-containing protein n=1 Tax=Joostella sp. CR20 TaxID=2804312 RepID=UPI00313B5AA6
MEKKRRDFINCDLINLSKTNKNFETFIATCIHTSKNEALSLSTYQLINSYGKGTISLIEFEEVSVQVSNFELERDLVFYDEFDENVLLMSFLLDGEKIISLRGNSDILNESQECYASKIANFKGYIRFTGGKPLRQVTIRLPYSFLKQKGIADASMFKSFADEDIVQPITNEILSVLMSFQFEVLNLQELRLVAEAKVLELLALQMQLYKEGVAEKVNASQDKILKKVYAAKQLMLENLDKNYSIKEMSRMLALNEYIFKKEFKRISGSSINEFYTQEKMNKAANLLVTSQMPIYEIAEQIGYKNATHFSAAFKRFYHKTPKKFRVSL